MQLEPSQTLQWAFLCWGDKHPDDHLGFRVPVVDAMFDIANCRNGGRGWRQYICPDHGPEMVPNSCGRRDCPHCVGRKAFLWAAAMETRLLKGPYAHVVFTLSSLLNPIWRHNRRHLADILFRAAAATILSLLARPEHMGGTPTVTAVLHTHGGTLVLHPHIHLLVSFVGLSPDNKIVKARRRTLLPYRALRRAFQMSFLHQLRNLSFTPRFHFPKNTTAADFRLFLDELFAQPQSQWNVRVFRRDNPVPVIRYLSRTVYGGPIRNDRLVAVNHDLVAFRYHDWRNREEGTEHAPLALFRLPLDTFVQRWSEHVHDQGLNAVRHFGLLAPGKREQLDTARALLEQTPLPPERPIDEPKPEPLVRCKHCQRPMTHRELPPTRPDLAPKARLLLRARDSPFFRWLAAA